MKVIYGTINFPKLKRSVVAIGNFDGVHLAHQHLISKSISKANQINAKAVVLTFWPHPNKVLYKKDTPLLSSLEHRLRLIGKFNPDYCLIVKFSPAFSKTTTEEFVKEILLKKLGMRWIYIGDNFRLGNDRTGSINDLINLGKIFNFKIGLSNVLKIKGHKVSSSLIRKLIRNLKLKQAQELLKREVSLIGKVSHGDKRGRLLGYPTVNIKPQHEVIPPSGVYAVKLFFQNKMFYGLCYIGSAPTFKRDKRVEAHIFDFNRQIYNELIEIRFIKFIRAEKKFKDKELLIAQINRDILEAKRIFKSAVKSSEFLTV